MIPNRAAASSNASFCALGILMDTLGEAYVELDIVCICNTYYTSGSTSVGFTFRISPEPYFHEVRDFLEVVRPRRHVGVSMGSTVSMAPRCWEPSHVNVYGVRNVHGVSTSAEWDTTR